MFRRSVDRGKWGAVIGDRPQEASVPEIFPTHFFLDRLAFQKPLDGQILDRLVFPFGQRSSPFDLLGPSNRLLLRGILFLALRTVLLQNEQRVLESHRLGVIEFPPLSSRELRQIRAREGARGRCGTRGAAVGIVRGFRVFVGESEVRFFEFVGVVVVVFH